MATDDLLNIFWKTSGIAALSDAFKVTTEFAMGTAADMTAQQVSVVKGAWSAIAKMPKRMDDFYIKSMVNLLMSFGLGAEETQGIVGGFVKGKPDVPIVGGLWLFVCNLLVMQKIMTTGLHSAGELIDKKYRTIIRPGVGSINDWISANRRMNEPEGFEALRHETGMPEDWYKTIELATQWWPGVGDLQTVFRRGHIDEKTFVESLGSLGVKAPGWIELLKATTFDVPAAENVLEYYRRKGLDWEHVDDWLTKAGFSGTTAELLKGTARRLVEVPSLYEMRRRDLIDDRELSSTLGSHGYAAADTKKLGGLWEQLPDGFQLTQAYFRGHIRKRDYLEGLGRLGYSKKTADLLETIAWQLPGPADLMRFGVREVFTPAIAARFGQYLQYPDAMTKWANKIGMDKEIALMYWAAHWDLPAIGQMFDMFHRGIISRADLKMGVRAADVMPFWQDKVIDLSYRLIPRRTLPRLIRQGLVDQTDAIRRFRRLGYSPTDSGIMAESAGLSAVQEERDLTKADILNAVRYGWWTLQEARTALEDMQYSQAAVTYYLADATRRKALEDARADADAVIADVGVVVDLTRSEVVRGYSAGMIDRSVAGSMLEAVGASAEAAGWKLDYADLVKIREAKEHAAKHYKRLFDGHLRIGTAIENDLLRSGYTAEEARRLVAEWTLERDVDDELAAVRDRKPTVADLAKWLKIGILDVDGWVDGMAEQGYPDPIIAMNLEEILLTTGA